MGLACCKNLNTYIEPKLAVFNSHSFQYIISACQVTDRVKISFEFFVISFPFNQFSSCWKILSNLRVFKQVTVQVKNPLCTCQCDKTCSIILSSIPVSVTSAWLHAACAELHFSVFSHFSFFFVWNYFLDFCLSITSFSQVYYYFQKVSRTLKVYWLC